MTQQQKALVEMLSKHPILEARIMEICDIVKNDSGRFITVDETEAFLREQVRNLGQEVMGEWAIDQSEKLAEEVAKHKGTTKHSKKN